MADALIAGPPGRPHHTAGTTGTPTGPATYDGRSVPILCALVAALSVAATVLTVVAWNDLLIRDAVFSLVTGRQPRCTRVSVGWSSAAPAT